MKKLGLRTFSIFIFLFVLNNASIKSQFKKETIYFESANPFSLSHIIKELNKLDKQEVFGQLTIPFNGTDANGDSLTYEIIHSPLFGDIEMVIDTGFTYNPYNNFHGADSFTYVA